MDPFTYRDRSLCCEGVRLEDVARRHGTPCFVYSRAHLEQRWREFDEALAGVPHLVCYAVKANGNLAVLDVLARLGSGFDIVSGGELARVLAAGGDAGRTVFAGVGKTEAEMEAALAAGVKSFNVESAGEIERLESVARTMGRPAPVSLRVNPDVDPRTHPYISTGLRETKFGVPFEDAPALYRRMRGSDSLRPVGIDCHIGSQITELEPFGEAFDRILELADALRADGMALGHVNLGGGLGVRYRDETPPAPAAYAALITRRLAGRDLSLVIEPGRAIAARAGVLLASVQYLKENGGRRYAIVDAAMNDLIRPALYDAWQGVLPVREAAPDARAEVVDVVGPVCESTDFLARERELAVAAGDLIAIECAGAYAAAMSSNYNARPRAPEVLVDGEAMHLARRRETVEELMSGESLLPRAAASAAAR